MKAMMKRFFSVLTMTVMLNFVTVAGWSQQQAPLVAIDSSYVDLVKLSGEANTQRRELDTIQFPWTEYSKGALGNALWRTVYLFPEDEAKLAGRVTLPANSSDQTRAELDYLLRLQQNRTKEEVRRAEHIANIGSFPNIINPTDPDFRENMQNLFYIVSTATGKQYSFSDYPATTKLLMNCIQDIRATEFRLKKHFVRPRPYHLDPKMQPLARINSPSFPSGHSLWAYTEAYVFGELIPAIRPALVSAAAEVHKSREILGIHYPSDNNASRVIGWYLLHGWYKNPEFRADLHAAAAEWE